MKNSGLSWQLWALLYFAGLSLFAIYSFSMTDPNLVLSTWQPYWEFQQWMWQTFFVNEQLLTITYASLIIILVGSHLGLVRSIDRSRSFPTVSLNRILLGLLALSLPLLVSYNALSHDVFNYMFNAKMVAIYQANPHVQVALDFAQDPWTRFMHNTHTAAPYGYGWTILSLIPFGLGQFLGGKFALTWIFFRVASLVSLSMMIAVLWWLSPKSGRGTLSWSKLAVVFFSPLVLLEILSSSHNDLWMMAPAMLSLGLLALPKRRMSQVVLALSLLGASIFIKIVTVVLIPVAAGLLIRSYLPQSVRQLFERYWPLFAAGLMFIPLLTARSQQFHPWYLTWVMVWLPLFGTYDEKIKQTHLSWWERLAQLGIVTLSISSLFRYLPWLWAGGFDQTVIVHQKLITWLPLVVVGLWWLIPAGRASRSKP